MRGLNPNQYSIENAQRKENAHLTLPLLLPASLSQQALTRLVWWANGHVGTTKHIQSAQWISKLYFWDCLLRELSQWPSKRARCCRLTAQIRPRNTVCWPKVKIHARRQQPPNDTMKSLGDTLVIIELTYYAYSDGRLSQQLPTCVPFHCTFDPSWSCIKRNWGSNS